MLKTRSKANKSRNIPPSSRQQRSNIGATVATDANSSGKRKLKDEVPNQKKQREITKEVQTKSRNQKKITPKKSDKLMQLSLNEIAMIPKQLTNDGKVFQLRLKDGQLAEYSSNYLFLFLEKFDTRGYAVQKLRIR